MDGTIIMSRPDAGDWDAPARIVRNTGAAPEIPPIPVGSLVPGRDSTTRTGVLPFDLSAKMYTSMPATTPHLLASCIRIGAGDKLPTRAVASAQLFCVVSGLGQTQSEHGTVKWAKGDIIVLPRTGAMTHVAAEDSVLYWVHDGPLLGYLGVAATEMRFRPAHFSGAAIQAELALAAQDTTGANHRRGVWLQHEDCDLILNATHTIGAGLNLLPAASSQLALRHNAASISICLSAKTDTYTLMGDELDAHGAVIPEYRVDWQPGCAFVTPPGKWHSHHNESDWDATVLTIQDSGLIAYARNLRVQKA